MAEDMNDLRRCGHVASCRCNSGFDPDKPVGEGTFAGMAVTYDARDLHAGIARMERTEFGLDRQYRRDMELIIELWEDDPESWGDEIKQLAEYLGVAS